MAEALTAEQKFMVNDMIAEKIRAMNVETDAKIGKLKDLVVKFDEKVSASSAFQEEVKNFAKSLRADLDEKFQQAQTETQVALQKMTRNETEIMGRISAAGTNLDNSIAEQRLTVNNLVRTAINSLMPDSVAAPKDGMGLSGGKNSVLNPSDFKVEKLHENPKPEQCRRWMNK